jgi:hypothetical protein
MEQQLNDDEIRKAKIRERQRRYREKHPEKNNIQNRKDAMTHFMKVREDPEKYEEFKRKQRETKSVSYFIKQVENVCERYKEFENNERVKEIINIRLLKFISGGENQNKIIKVSVI